MTIDQALHTVDELKPNQVPRAQKIQWLNQVDGRVFAFLFQTHCPDEHTPEAFAPYTQDSPPDTELLVRPPYDEMYRFYLEMQIDLANLELEKYNNSAALYANAWSQFARAYHRAHRPLSQGESLRL